MNSSLVYFSLKTGFLKYLKIVKVNFSAYCTIYQVCYLLYHLRIPFGSLPQRDNLSHNLLYINVILGYATCDIILKKPRIDIVEEADSDYEKDIKF